MLMSDLLEQMKNPRPRGDSLPHTDDQLIRIWQDSSMRSTRRTIQPVMESRGYQLNEHGDWYAVEVPRYVANSPTPVEYRFEVGSDA